MLMPKERPFLLLLLLFGGHPSSVQQAPRVCCFLFPPIPGTTQATRAVPCGTPDGTGVGHMQHTRLIPLFYLSSLKRQNYPQMVGSAEIKKHVPPTPHHHQRRGSFLTDSADKLKIKSNEKKRRYQQISTRILHIPPSQVTEIAQ